MLSESPFRPVVPALLGLLALVLAGASPVAAQRCGSDSGYFIDFFASGEIPSIPGDRCSDTFQCAKPKPLGGSVRKVDPSCDAEGDNTCALDLLFSLEFRGNSENIDDVGLQLAPTPVIYWFDGPAATDCQPSLGEDCGQVGICGFGFFKINGDFTDTWLRLGVASCNTPVPTLHSGLFSILAEACPARGSCPKQELDELQITEAKVKKALGCVDPPKQDCTSCRECALPGVPADGQPPRIGGPELGAGGGAYLSYAAGGAGFPGLPGSAAWNVTLGRGWSHDYAERIVPVPDETRVFLITRTGVFREWRSPDGAGVYQEVSPSSEYRTLTWLGAGLGWELAGLDGTVTLFDDSGLWRSTTDRNGNAKTASYSGGALASVNFPDDRREDFTYDPGTGKLASITEVGIDGSTRAWSYTWSGDDLTRVDRPDGTALRFLYADAAHPGHLTRIELEGTDGTSVRVLRGYEYSPEGRVVRTWRGDVSPTGPDAVEVWALALDDPEEPTVATATDPLGREITYQLGRDTVSSNVKVLSISGDCPVCGLAPNTQLFYEDPDHPLRPTRTVDGRGTETVTSYDAFGQVTSRTEAFGDPEARTITWTYDPAFPALVSSVERPSVAGGASMRTTDFTRDADGNASSRTISGVEAGSAFTLTTSTTWNAEGRPVTVDPPGHGTADQTSFTYDPARGNLVADSRTDPLVGTTTFGHDPFHRRTSVTDPNGVEARTAFDALDRVTEVRQAAGTAAELLTVHSYNAFRDLSQTQLPAGNVIEYGYDAAGRLVSVERKPDAATPGERVLYTLDAVGNRTREELQRWDVGTASWVTEGETAFVYSTRCHLDQVVQAPGSVEEAVTEHAYDCNGNLERTWDPNHPRFPEDPDGDEPPPDSDSSSLSVRTHEEAPATTVYAYDALDRLITVAQPWGGEGGGQAVTTYGYDVQDHLVSVIDAEGNTTTYEYSDRDLLTREDSPVAGTTTHDYNEHGELTSTTDARGVTVVRTVDAADRVTEVSHPDSSLDVSFIYDAAPAACATTFPLGRLGEILRGGESVPYCYDAFGRPTRDGELTFAYDDNGNRTQVGYPGNVVASYTHDFADREASLTVQEGSDPAQTVVSGAAYLPSGPLASLTLGNGLAETRSFDRRYAPTGIAVSGLLDRIYTTDAVGNVTTIDHSTPTGRTISSYTYQDVQYFLIQGAGPWGQLTWTYDRIGNRLTEALPDSGDTPEEATYTYALNATGGNTPKLLRIDDLVGEEPGDFVAFGYDAAGHQTSIQRGTIEGPGPESLLDYDEASRLASLSRSDSTASTALTYDGRSFLGTSFETFSDSTDFTRTEPVYGSEGLLYTRAFHQESTTTSGGDDDGGSSTTVLDETNHVLYLAGRPVAELTVSASAGTTTLSFVTTDHLGAPMAVTDAAGSLVWLGGMEPWGVPYTVAPSSDDGGDGDGGGDGDTDPTSTTLHLTPRATGFPESGNTFLRLPGQWDDPTFRTTTFGGLYYNVHRWYQPGVGRYSRPDPLGLLVDINLYAYVRGNPLRWFDPLGLERVCCDKSPQELLERAQDASQRADDLRAGKGLEVRPGSGPIGTTICGAPSLGVPGDPTTFFDPVRFPPLSPCEKECTRVHEASHARTCREFGILITVSAQNTDEALAYRTEALCLLRAASERSIDVEEEFPDLRPIPIP